MSIPPRRYDPETYQEVANGVAENVYRHLEAQHAQNVATFGIEDGAPMLQGFIGGMIAFAVEGEMSQDDFRARVLKVIDEVWPQIEMDFASHKAGHPEPGSA
jgi:hypothetical protein